VWDVRARACVYELATGNNAVVSMVWDSGRSTLYAATQCNHVDRLGDHHDYRKARRPKEQRATAGDSEMESDGDDDDDEHEDDDDGGECWPKEAHHTEDYFGYMLDAGDHVICEIFQNVSCST
jgi:hypothetical protein